MNRTVRHLLLLTLVLVVGPARWVAVWADGPPLAYAPSDGVLVLRNGQTLEGQIAQSGDRYIIWINGSEIRLSADHVEMACDSLDDAYRQKRAAVRPGQLVDQLQLAQWCLRQELLDEAQRHLELARKIEAEAPGVAQLARQLELARDGPAPAQSVAVTTPSGPSSEELDQLLRRLPRETVTEFVTTIQPLVLHHCGSGGCHGSSEIHQWPLIRVPSGTAPRRRVTQRNLYNTLLELHPEQPEMSRLLRMARRPHGGRETPPLGGPDSPEFRQLADWVRTAVAGRLPIRAASAESTLPATLPEPDEAPLALPPSDNLAPSGPYVPVDPFDPEVFNRRYSPRVRDDQPPAAARD